MSAFAGKANKYKHLEFHRLYVGAIAGAGRTTPARGTDASGYLSGGYLVGFHYRHDRQGVPQALALWAYRPSTKGDPSQRKIKIFLKLTS
ncbi:MAG: hypothetical protein WBL48_12730, partial [Pseudolabrys sp.]